MGIYICIVYYSIMYNQGNLEVPFKCVPSLWGQP